MIQKAVDLIKAVIGKVVSITKDVGLDSEEILVDEERLLEVFYENELLYVLSDKKNFTTITSIPEDFERNLVIEIIEKKEEK